MLSNEQEAFMDYLFDLEKHEVINRLLCNNDTQCFTTDQYRVAWDNLLHIVPGTNLEWRKTSNRLYGENWERKHLLSCCDIVREVKPDVWTST